MYVPSIADVYGRNKLLWPVSLVVSSFGNLRTLETRLKSDLLCVDQMLNYIHWNRMNGQYLMRGTDRWNNMWQPYMGRVIINVMKLYINISIIIIFNTSLFYIIIIIIIIITSANSSTVLG